MAGPFGDVVTRVTTDKFYPLGFIVDIPAVNPGVDPNSGAKSWIYVQASELLPAGNVCVRAAAAITYSARRAQNTSTVGDAIGVAQHAIAMNSYGFIQRSGLAEVLTDGAGTTADVGIKVSNTTVGACEFAAVTDGTFGSATETAVSPALATCFINCQG